MANITATQLQAFRTLQSFSDFAATHGGKAVARLGGQVGAALTASTTDRAYKCIRSDADKLANDQIRTTLKRALCEMFGQKNEFRLENLPASVKAHLKISDFGENGGHPLLARRITQIMNAVKASGEWQAVKARADELAAHVERMRETAENVRNEMTDAFRDVKDAHTFDEALAKVLDNGDSAFRKALGGEIGPEKISTLKLHMHVVCVDNEGYRDTAVILNHLKRAYETYVRPLGCGAASSAAEGPESEGVIANSPAEIRESEVREAAIDAFLSSLAKVGQRIGAVREVNARQRRIEDSVLGRFGVSDVRNPFGKPLDYGSRLTKPGLLDKIRRLGKNSADFRKLQTAYMPDVDQRSIDAFLGRLAEYVEENAVSDVSFDPETCLAEDYFAATAEEIRNGIGEIVENFIEESDVGDDDAVKANPFLRKLGDVIARATVDLIVTASADGERLEGAD